MNASLWLLGLPLASVPFVYLSGRINVRMGQSAFAARWLAMMVLASLWVAFALTTQSGQAESLSVGAIPFSNDGISQITTLTALVVTTAVLIYSIPYVKDEAGEEKYYAALIAMAGSVIGLAHSADLFNLWVWFETLTISSYYLVMFRRNRSLEAGVKYLVQTAIGSAFVLLGVALVLMQTGVMDFDQIKAVATPDPLLLAAGGLLVVGFGVKIALFPLHTWLPDAHSQAPSSISAMLSGIVIEVALVALLRALALLIGVTLSWGVLLMAFGAVNMLGGNLLALRQTEVKRMLAYSSVSHVGYMLLGFGIAIVSAESFGAQGGFFHLLNHGLMKGLAFLTAGALMFALGSHSLTVSELSGAGRRYPVTSAAFTLALLSLAGLPPLAGFMSKWQIFAAGFATQNTLIALLVVFAALNSLLSLAYYMPLVNTLYRQEMSAGVAAGRALPLMMTAPLAVLALAILVLGVFPGLLDGLTAPAGQALVSIFGR